MTETTENNIVEPVVEMTAAEMLRHARTTGRRKREIPTIAKQLCIREEFLTALEEGNYTFIPEVVYILGFARNYAMELGLNPDEVVSKIKREMGLVPDCQAGGDDAAQGDSACAMPDSGRAAGMLVRAKKITLKYWKFALAAAVALVAIVLVAVMLGRGGDSEISAPVDNTAASAAQVASLEPAYNHAVRERFGTENRDNHDVVLQAAQESWVKIEDGRGNTVFSRVLVPGDVYYVPRGDKYKGTFGNAGGIDVWVGGKLAPKVGADHTRKTGISMSPEKLLAGAQ